MYGGPAKRMLGWYFQQEHLRAGIVPSPFAAEMNFDPARCPPDLQAAIRAARTAESALAPLVNGRFSGEPQGSPPSHERDLRRVTARQKRVVTKRMENTVREAFGLKRVGEAWVSETILFRMIDRILAPERVVFHYRGDEMEGLEIDIFVPTLSLGVEYQGQQHFHAVEAWGGETALANLRERDTKKRRLCKKNRIRLRYVNYYDPLTEPFVRNILDLDPA